MAHTMRVMPTAAESMTDGQLNTPRRPQSLDLRRFTCIIRYSSSSSEQFHL